MPLLFFFNDPATTEIYTLSLHDALPISLRSIRADPSRPRRAHPECPHSTSPFGHSTVRSEEHTSELQSHLTLVCRLLLEKKKHHDMARSRSRCHARRCWRTRIERGSARG